MTIDEVIDKVAEGHTWHEEEHTCAEGNDRCGGEGEVFKPIVGEIYESHAGNNGCHDTSYDSDGAIVDFPALQTLFDKETTEGGEKHNANSGPISLKQAAESGIGSSSKEEYDPIVETGYLFLSLAIFSFASARVTSSVKTSSERRLNRVMVSKLMPACARGEMQV